jgi:Pyruvate:ferredoxin oxidoreductase and related 2-oxoacid:ferredoxin oxidoreductases, gamma subunit
VQQASFVGCHHFGLLDRVDVLGLAAPGATLLLTASCQRMRSGMRCPARSRRRFSPKRIGVYAIDAGHIAREAGLAGRTNTVLQTCFFAISGVLPRDEAIAKIKAAIAKTYGRRGAEVVSRNHAAVDATLEGLHQIEVPAR